MAVSERLCHVNLGEVGHARQQYGDAMLRAEKALAEMQRCRGWWRPEVYDAFMESVGAPAWEESLAAPA